MGVAVRCKRNKKTGPDTQKQVRDSAGKAERHTYK